jgi:hypothetical protein
MNRLEIVKKAFDQYQNQLHSYSDQTIGVGIGFENERSLKEEQDEQYAIVVLLPEVMTESDQKRFPDKLQFKASEMEGLNLKGGEEIEVKVRVERKKIELLGVQDDLSVPLEEMEIMSGTHTGGDPIYNNKGRWIGTGGCALKLNGRNCIVSNDHVMKIAGMSNAICNKNGANMATVNWLNPSSDSASAIMLPDTGFNNNIPGIGKLQKIVGGINVGWYGKKRGSATGNTDFHIRWWGNINGNWTVIGVNMGGLNVPVVGHGDSGSVVVGNNNELVALVYAGGTDIGPGPGGRVFSEIFAIDITVAFPNPQLL